MTPTTAIQRAEQWRKEGACGEAAKVAIALLNELERYADKSADYALKASEYAGKYANLLQAVTDPENQPNQYGATVVAVNMSADQEKELIALHAKLAGETLRADQGWQRYEAANNARNNAELALSRAIPEGHVVVPGWLPIEQCKREHGKRYLLQKDCGDGTLPSITIGYSLDGDEHWFYQDVHHSIEEYGYRVTHFQEMPGYAAAPANKEG